MDSFKDVSHIVSKYKEELNRYSKKGLLKTNINNIEGEIYFFENDSIVFSSPFVSSFYIYFQNIL